MLLTLNTFRLINDNNNTKGLLSISSNGDTAFWLTSGTSSFPMIWLNANQITGNGTLDILDASSHVLCRIGGNELELYNSGTKTVLLRSKTGYNNGGGLDCYNSSGTGVAYIGSNNASGGAGQLNLSNSSGTANIQADGSTGNMWVVNLYQTSSKRLRRT